LLDKRKNIQLEAEEPEWEEDETSDEDGDTRIRYNDDFLEDDTPHDDDETLPSDSTLPPHSTIRFNPNFRPLDSNDSLFNTSGR